MKTLGFIVAFTFVSLVGPGKLKLPLEGGHFLGRASVRLAHNDNILFLIPGKSLIVKAAQPCLINSVLMSDSIFSIVTSGNYMITYSGLRKVLVKKGDKVVQGQIMGSLGDFRDSSNKLMLELYIQKQGKSIIDTNIFARK